MDTYEKKKIRDRIAEFEGFRSKVYKCPAGKLTIGYGRNVQDVGITEAEASRLLYNDIDSCIAKLVDELPWFESLNLPRQAAMIDLVFNLGMAKLLTFKKFIAAMEACKYRTAKEELLDSAYAKQVGHRAVENADMICDGEWL